MNSVSPGTDLEDELIENLDSIGMLSPDALRMLRECALRSKGATLEVGPYIGASTIAIASGLGCRRLLTVETGGSRLDHQQVPSFDILVDLKANLSRFGVADRVTVIEGWSHDQAVVAQVSRHLKGHLIGFLFYDADGDIPIFIANYGQYISESCLLAFDDYKCAEVKSARVDATVNLLMRTGAVRQTCVIGNTWFGEVLGAEGLRILRRAGNLFVKDEGPCVTVAIVRPWTPDSHYGIASEMRLFEDGREIGPAHTRHVDIRSLGRGRYSHYSHEGQRASDGTFAARLYFSASDNSDPGTNGRRYTARYRDRDVDLHDWTILDAGLK
jgi:hypothetical protein